MPAPPEILELVGRFEENLAAYASDRYNETQLRRGYEGPGLLLKLSNLLSPEALSINIA